MWLPSLLSILLAWALLPHIAVPLLERLHGTTASAYDRLVAALSALLLLAGLSLLSSIMCGGLWSFILRGVPIAKPYYVGFGADERRLAILAALKALLLFAWASAAMIFVGAMMALVTHISAPVSPLVLALAILISLLTLSWLMTRLSLAGPATISAQRVSLKASWQASAHNVARLQQVAALLMVPAALLTLIFALLLMSLAWWLSTHAPNTGVTAVELARYCTALLRELLPVVLLFFYLLILLLAALFIVARALEYQALAPPPGGPL
ncbi:hypothetical protein [Roseateles sp.]|uniref:hypothetical protein n=1 Tax=Roseateles sp. TaxID=1971397 RepID=UPI0025F991BF|nr:hypothetical protein [Roseateles sp.]MBV8033654.1 hypothetical protein [Roseateles sp.]